MGPTYFHLTLQCQVILIFLSQLGFITTTHCHSQPPTTTHLQSHSTDFHPPECTFVILKFFKPTGTLLQLKYLKVIDVILLPNFLTFLISAKISHATKRNMNLFGKNYTYYIPQHSSKSRFFSLYGVYSKKMITHNFVYQFRSTCRIEIRTQTNKNYS